MDLFTVTEITSATVSVNSLTHMVGHKTWHIYTAI